MKIPPITKLIDACCKAVSSPKGHDVSASEGRAFIRQFFLQLNKMKPTVRQAFIDKYLAYYSKRKGKFRATTNIAIKPTIRDKAFQKEYKAFLGMSDQDKRKFNGLYVAIYNGKIADWDVNESELVGRFFKKRGNVRAYIDKVGGETIIPIVRSPRKIG